MITVWPETSLIETSRILAQKGREVNEKYKAQYMNGLVQCIIFVTLSILLSIF